jgi:hypothetical protein
MEYHFGCNIQSVWSGVDSISSSRIASRVRGQIVPYSAKVDEEQYQVGVFKRQDSDSAAVSGDAGVRASNTATSRRIPSPSSVFVNQPTALPYNAPRVLTASASQLRLNDRTEFEQFRARRNASSSAWQAEAWEYYDAIGEIKYAFNLVASVVSRIRIFAASVDDPSQAPVPVKESSIVDARLASAAERAVDRLNSAYGGQAGLLKDAALNLSVSGECYLVQMPARPASGEPESWDIRSVDEVMTDAKGGYSVIGRREQGVGQMGTSNTMGVTQLSQKAFVGRIWRSHPRFTDEADSSIRGLLDLCAELLLLNRTFRATARSRLNAGAMYLPDGLSVAAQADPDYPYDSEDGIEAGFTAEEAEDEFEEQLIDAMTTPIRDEESASAVVPLIIRGPAELGDAIKQFKFERSFDPALAERSDRVLERIMQGLDVPKDVVSGMANVKYSNALQIDESLYKAHIEPLMLLIVDALTVAYLRPYLIANGYTPSEVSRLVIWYDPSAVSTRNDRAADANEGFDRGAISFDTWRRAHGFSDQDAPTPNELVIRMLQDRAMFTPELTEAMLGAIAPEVMNAVRDAQQTASVAPMPPELEQALQQASGGTSVEGGEEESGLPTEGDGAGEQQPEQEPDVTPGGGPEVI